MPPAFADSALEQIQAGFQGNYPSGSFDNGNALGLRAVHQGGDRLYISLGKFQKIELASPLKRGA